MTDELCSTSLPTVSIAVEGPPDLIVEVIEGPMLPEKSPHPAFADSYDRNTTIPKREFNVTASLLTYKRKRHELAFRAGIITSANFNGKYFVF